MSGKDPDKITSVEGFTQAVGQVDYYAAHHAHVRVWFRGQADAAWKLSPIVFRDEFKVEDKGRGIDEERLLAERHIAQDFMTYAAQVVTTPIGRTELYCMQQHFSAPTRLLDWTTNPLIGLFFAVHEERDDPSRKQDAAVYMLDAYQWKRGMNTLFSEELGREISYIYDWDDTLRTELSKEVLAVRPAHTFGRVTAQSGHFTLCNENNKEITESTNTTLRKFVIDRDSKPDIREQLSRVGVNRFSVYGDLDNLSKWIRSRYGERW